MTYEASRRVPKPHHNFVPEYQMSGIPWVKTIELPAAINAAALIANIDDYKVDFEFVTRWIKLHSHNDAGKAGVFIYFNETAAKTAYDVAQDTHYYLMDLEEATGRLELKCKTLYLIPSVINKESQVSIMAGLTNIPSEDFPDQTKNNGFVGIEN